MSEEEKTIEEQTETIIDAIETENEATIDKIETEPETKDDVREAFEINKEDEPREALGAPLIRALGDPPPADPNMIQKHLDNFLAKIAGETPIDENVRDSTEYWLKRIAESGGGGGGETKLYSHVIRFRATNNFNNEGLCSIITTAETEYTKETFCAWLQENGFVGSTTGSNKMLPATGIAYGTNPAGIVVGVYKRSDETQLIAELAITGSGISRYIDPVFVSDTVTPIN